MTWNAVWENIFTSQAWGRYPCEDLIRFVAVNFYKATERSAVKILEIGCGPGANIWFMAREGFGFVGMDGSPSAISQAAARLDSEIPDWRSRGELIVGDFENMPFGDETFDAVIDNEAVYCNPLATSIAIYRDAARVLKPGGRIYVKTFADGTWGDGTGIAAGDGEFHCDEGPLAGKGLSRFTTRDQISTLLGGFDRLDIGLTSRWTGEESRSIREWVVTGVKRS